MVTLRKLLYQCKRLLSAGTTPKDSKLNDAYIIAEIRQVTHGLLKMEWYAGKQEGRVGASPILIATYPDIPVLNDTIRKRNYSVLPAYPMNVEEGVQQVKPQTGVPSRDVAMIPIAPHEYELFKSLLVGSEIMKDQWTFEVDRDKIWYTKKDDKTLLESKINFVEAKILVHDPSQISEDDNFPIPPEMELEVIKGVLVLHGYQPAQVHDLINNDNPNQ